MSEASSGRARGLTEPASRLIPVIADDDRDLPGGLTRGLFVASAGALRVADATGAIVELASGDAQYHPIRILRVLTATTAAGLVALY